MSGCDSSMARMMSSHRSTATTEYPCSRSSQERALRTAGFSSATRTRGSAATEELTKAVPLDVPTAQDGNRVPLARHIDEPFQQRGDGDGTARLHDELESVE